MSQNVFLLLPDNVYDGAVAIARKRGTTLSALLVEALSDTVDQQQQPVQLWPEKRPVGSDPLSRSFPYRRTA